MTIQFKQDVPTHVEVRYPKPGMWRLHMYNGRDITDIFEIEGSVGEVAAAFRYLLTHGFYVIDEETDEVYSQDAPYQHDLTITKPWRNEVWKAFRELEDKLCPVRAKERQAKETQR